MDWFTLAGIGIAAVLVLTIAIMGGWIAAESRRLTNEVVMVHFLAS